MQQNEDRAENAQGGQQQRESKRAGVLQAPERT